MVSATDSSQLSERSLYLFKALVEHFIDDGAPVGSRTLSKDSDLNLSPASIRNVMADLEDLAYCIHHIPLPDECLPPRAIDYLLIVYCG